MKSCSVRLLRLEDRLTPAVATWDGGGGDVNWQTAANWVGDTAPQPGDDLVFPAAAARFANVNDFPDGTAFNNLAINGKDYDISGNRIALAGGLSSELPSEIATTPGPRLAVALTLTAPQTFDRDNGSEYVLTLAGPIDLQANLLEYTGSAGRTKITGVISGAGGIAVGGNGLELAAQNTYTGQTTVGDQLLLTGRVVGPVVLGPSGSLMGIGVTGPLTSAGGSIEPGFSFFGPPGDPVGTLTTGNLATQGGSYFPQVTARGSDRIDVIGTVQLSNTALIVGTDGMYQVRDNDVFTILTNDGTDPVNGIFTNIPEGTIVLFGPVPLKISYVGGDGNDIVLTAVRVPATAVGAGFGGAPVVNVYDGAGVLLRQFAAYDLSFRGGVHVAVGDINNDGANDIVTAPGVGGGPHVKVFDGRTGAVIREFFAYDASFRGGVNISVAGMNSLTPDIITGAGVGGGPHVRVFDGDTGAVITEFLAYSPSFTGGVSVAGINAFSNRFGITFGRVVTGAGPGGGPHVRVFGGTDGFPLSQFFAYDPSFRGGVNVAAVFPGTQFSAPTVITAPGAGGGPVVRSFSTEGLLTGQFLAYDDSFRGGVVVSAGPRNGQSFLTGPASNGTSLVRQWRLSEPSAIQEREVVAFDPAFQGGVFVG